MIKLTLLGTLHVTDIKLEATPKPAVSAYRLQFKANNLARKDLNGKSGNFHLCPSFSYSLDPYFVVKGCPKPYWSYPYCSDPGREAAARGKKKKGTEAKAVQIYRYDTANASVYKRLGLK